ncbi:hypothetical protein [Mycolicibacterium fortuitum]|uniref:hypothetical protein n=1 Tax=Mycolicibacterium fortuitum TaxID=1766 RepID=UPI0007EAD93A|nr:hypothetical protein [Mycolicibacterium fortuitum]OBB38024.1 hypothetical protein A5763_29630 [Mycolicibacterium fortuitum]OBB44865.1 hypothetical protein A5754_10495 [Mycolicibacterium fortuitum]OBB77512.1 hypothetical protein A5755_11035 [Mycolicibacterium fortuitum]OBF81448.1 hypothetical protein A5751_17090 [Mycolicibacterium fortuitum]OBG10931.1 hypothetical protein A5768_00655 [Mycolicibacterium fortuitum]
MKRLSRRPGLPPVQPLAPVIAKAPKARASQAEQRERRRKRLPVHLAGTFNLAAEVTAVCGPAAHEVSQLANPLVLSGDIEAVADAVHEVLSVAVGMLAADRHQPAADAARTRQLAADLAIRPAALYITDEEIISGSWAVALAEWVAPYGGDLAALLGRAQPPGADALRGNPSASERIERALRALDGAVLDLTRRVPKARARQSLPSMAEFNAQLKAKADAERQQRVLAKLGAV